MSAHQSRSLKCSMGKPASPLVAWFSLRILSGRGRGLPRSGCDDTSTSIGSFEQSDTNITTLHLVWCNRNSLYTYRSNFSALSRRRRSLGLLALATCANADRSKKGAARRARWHEHPGCVRFSHKGLQARAAKSSLARPFMALSYVPSYFCYTTLALACKMPRNDPDGHCRVSTQLHPRIGSMPKPVLDLPSLATKWVMSRSRGRVMSRSRGRRGVAFAR